MAKLLVVEDDQDVAELLGEVLRFHGHEVRIAENGRDGLDAVAVARPDAVLLDVEMPVLDGPGMALRLLIRDCGDEEIPLVLLSGIASLDEVARRVGTPYFLAKPYNVTKVMALLARALTERRAPVPATMVSDPAPSGPA